MAIVYIETNFLMSIATGRDPQANVLLQRKPASVRLAIPGICYMEALSVLEDELKARNRFANELDLQVSQLQRDRTSQFAKHLLSHLEKAKVENQELADDIQKRLFAAVNQIVVQSETIPLTSDIVQEQW